MTLVRDQNIVSFDLNRCEKVSARRDAVLDCGACRAVHDLDRPGVFQSAHVLCRCLYVVQRL